MKPVYYHYTKWEDFQHGMYNEVKEGRDDRIKLAVALLSDAETLRKYMQKVADQWTCSTTQVFTNPSYNHRPYLGQSACCLYADVKEDETRAAWGLLTEEQRYKANKAADSVYEKWVNEYEQMTNECYQLVLDGVRA